MKASTTYTCDICGHTGSKEEIEKCEKGHERIPQKGDRYEDRHGSGKTIVEVIRNNVIYFGNSSGRGIDVVDLNWFKKHMRFESEWKQDNVS